MSRSEEPKPLDLAAEWRSMQRRLVAHIRSGDLTDLDPAPTGIPAASYVDPVRFEAERERIFRDVPLLVGFSGELAKPGDRILFDAAGPPILVVRGEQGRLRAFLNFCPHRGARLVGLHADPPARLSVPRLDLRSRGRPRGAARRAGLRGRRRRRRSKQRSGRRRGAAARACPGRGVGWHGLRGARPGDDAIDVADFLGPAAPLFAALELGSLERVCEDVLPVAANWKFAYDTFCEVYHVAVLHRDSLSRNLYPQVAIFDHYGLHQRYSGAGRDYEALLEKPESEWPAMSYQAVHAVFPNTTFAFTHALDGKTPVVSMFRLFPGASVGESITLATTYRRPGADAASREDVEAMHRTVLAIVDDEDYRIARDARRSLEHAPPGFCLTLGRSEPLLRRYHAELARRIGMPL